MRNDKTTPRPWVRREGDPSKENLVAVVRGITVYGPYSAASCGADANLIVRAVNAHEALTDLCELLYTKLLRSSLESRMQIQRELCALRDTIALARGMSPEDVQNEFEAKARGDDLR